MTLKSLNFTLLVVNLDSEDLSQLANELHKKRMMAPEFFALTPMVVNVTDSELQINFELLQQTIEASGFILSGITGLVSDDHKQQASKQSIAVLHSSKKRIVKKEKASEETQEVEEVVSVLPSSVKPKLHIGRVRSGQQIYAKECDLVVTGDVGAGAEVIADGNIHIYGALRGRALAGAVGNVNAAIFCQNLQPELVSIAGVYKVSEQLPKDKWSTACSIFLEDHNMIFSSLNNT